MRQRMSWRWITPCVLMTLIANLCGSDARPHLQQTGNERSVSTVLVSRDDNAQLHDQTHSRAAEKGVGDHLRWQEKNDSDSTMSHPLHSTSIDSHEQVRKFKKPPSLGESMKLVATQLLNSRHGSTEHGDIKSELLETPHRIKNQQQQANHQTGIENVEGGIPETTTSNDGHLDQKKTSDKEQDQIIKHNKEALISSLQTTKHSENIEDINKQINTKEVILVDKGQTTLKTGEETKILSDKKNHNDNLGSSNETVHRAATESELTTGNTIKQAKHSEGIVLDDVIRETEEISHRGVAVPVILEDHEMETLQKVEEVLLPSSSRKTHASSTTVKPESGLSTWILLSGSNTPSTPSPNKNTTVKKNKSNTTTTKPIPANKKSASPIATTTPLPPSTVKSKITTSTKSTPTSLLRNSTPNPATSTARVTTITKLITQESVQQPSTNKSALVSNNKNQDTLTIDLIPAMTRKPPSTMAKPDSPDLVTTVAPSFKKRPARPEPKKNTTSSTPYPITTSYIVEEVSESSLESIDTATNSTETTTKRTRRPGSNSGGKKKKNKNKRRKNRPSTTVQVESKITEEIGENSTKVSTKDRPLSTRIYNYLAREVMPSVGVGLLGLVVTAGLAGLIMYPFGGGLAAKRTYDEKESTSMMTPQGNFYYYNEDYGPGAGGQSEEVVLQQVLEGMQEGDTKYGDDDPSRYGVRDAEISHRHHDTRLQGHESTYTGPVTSYSQAAPGNSHGMIYSSTDETRYSSAVDASHATGYSPETDTSNIKRHDKTAQEHISRYAGDSQNLKFSGLRYDTHYGSEETRQQGIKYGSSYRNENFPSAYQVKNTQGISHTILSSSDELLNEREISVTKGYEKAPYYSGNSQVFKLVTNPIVRESERVDNDKFKNFEGGVIPGRHEHEDSYHSDMHYLPKETSTAQVGVKHDRTEEVTENNKPQKTEIFSGIYYSVSNISNNGNHTPQNSEDKHEDRSSYTNKVRYREVGGGNRRAVEYATNGQDTGFEHGPRNIRLKRDTSNEKEMIMSSLFRDTSEDTLDNEIETLITESKLNQNKPPNMKPTMLTLTYNNNSDNRNMTLSEIDKNTIVGTNKVKYDLQSSNPMTMSSVSEASELSDIHVKKVWSEGNKIDENNAKLQTHIYKDETGPITLNSNIVMSDTQVSTEYEPLDILSTVMPDDITTYEYIDAVTTDKNFEETTFTFTETTTEALDNLVPELPMEKPHEPSKFSIASILRQIARLKLRFGINFLKSTSQAFTNYLDRVQEQSLCCQPGQTDKTPWTQGVYGKVSFFRQVDAMVAVKALEDTFQSEK